MRDDDERAPTEVLKVTPGAAEDKQVEEVYANDGKELSAGSVAAPRNANQFVAGSRTDHKLLICTRSVPRQRKPESVLLRWRDDLKRLRHDLPRRIDARPLPDVHVRRCWRFRLGIADVTPRVAERTVFGLSGECMPQTLPSFCPSSTAWPASMPTATGTPRAITRTSSAPNDLRAALLLAVAAAVNCASAVPIGCRQPVVRFGLWRRSGGGFRAAGATSGFAWLTPQSRTTRQLSSGCLRHTERNVP